MTARAVLGKEWPHRGAKGDLTIGVLAGLSAFRRLPGKGGAVGAQIEECRHTADQKKADLRSHDVLEVQTKRACIRLILRRIHRGVDPH